MPQVERAIVVEAAPDTAYQVWRNFENLPNFMGNIEEVRDTGAGSYHWRAKGPLGSHAEWDVLITCDEPGRAIAWQSPDDAEGGLRTNGAVAFERVGQATRVMLTLDYDLPGGALGEVMARIFANPAHQAEQDLLRFKQSIEANTGYIQDGPRTVVDDGPTTQDAGEAIAMGAPSGAHSADRPMARADDHQTVGKRPQHKPPTAIPRGPGMAGEASPSPATTGTPGGTLGAPTERELKANPEAASDRGDRL